MRHRRTKRGDSDRSGCPLTSNPKLRAESEAEIASIRACFPRGVSRPALRALYAAGLTTLKKLATVSEAELLALHGMGPRALEPLREGLKAIGLRFRGAESD